MYINKYPKLTVARMKEILNKLNNDDEILVINYYNKDCQEIEGRNVNNAMLILPLAGENEACDFQTIDISEEE